MEMQDCYKNPKRVIPLSGPGQGCFGQKMSARHHGISGLAGATDSAHPRLLLRWFTCGWLHLLFWTKLFPGVCTPSPGISLRLSPALRCNGCLHVISQLPVSCSRPRTRCTHLNIPSAWPRVGQWWVDGLTDGWTDDHEDEWTKTDSRMDG